MVLVCSLLVVIFLDSCVKQILGGGNDSTSGSINATTETRVTNTLP
jgi:hypothetical protein